MHIARRSNRNTGGWNGGSRRKSGLLGYKSSRKLECYSVNSNPRAFTVQSIVIYITLDNLYLTLRALLMSDPHRRSGLNCPFTMRGWMYFRTRPPDLNRYKAALQLAIDVVSQLARAFGLYPQVLSSSLLVLVPGPGLPSPICQLSDLRWGSKFPPSTSLSQSGIWTISPAYTALSIFETSP